MLVFILEKQFVFRFSMVFIRMTSPLKFQMGLNYNILFFWQNFFPNYLGDFKENLPQISANRAALMMNI